MFKKFGCRVPSDVVFSSHMQESFKPSGLTCTCIHGKSSLFSLFHPPQPTGPTTYFTLSSLNTPPGIILLPIFSEFLIVQVFYQLHKNLGIDLHLLPSLIWNSPWGYEGWRNIQIATEETASSGAVINNLYCTLESPREFLQNTGAWSHSNPDFLNWNRWLGAKA